MQRQNFRPGEKKDFQELELANNLAGTALPLVRTECRPLTWRVVGRTRPGLKSYMVDNQNGTAVHISLSPIYLAEGEGFIIRKVQSGRGRGQLSFLPLPETSSPAHQLSSPATLSPLSPRQESSLREPGTLFKTGNGSSPAKATQAQYTK